MKSFFIFNQKFETVPFVVVSLCVLALMGLGNWQLKRLKEKENCIAKIELNIKNPPIEMVNLQTAPELYTKIEVEGHFLDGENIFLYGRRSAYPEKDGYYLLSPFKDKLGNVYLVSRAWIPQSAKGSIRSFKSKNEETITAFVMPGEEKRVFIPDNDKKNNIWFTLDLNEASHRLGITKKDFYLMQVNSTDLPDGAFPLTSTYLNVIRNDHLEYAITWYSLAGFLCIIYFLYNKKQS
jgi:surfeit locus 1 family protein